jgi:hypothetical protein
MKSKVVFAIIMLICMVTPVIGAPILTGPHELFPTCASCPAGSGSSYNVTYDINMTEQQAAINLLSGGTSYNYTYQLNMSNQQVSINALLSDVIDLFTNATEQQGAINLLGASNYNYTYQQNMTDQEIKITALNIRANNFAINDTVSVLNETILDERMDNSKINETILKERVDNLAVNDTLSVFNETTLKTRVDAFAVNDTLQLTNNTEQQGAINLLGASNYNYTYQQNMTDQETKITALNTRANNFAINDTISVSNETILKTRVDNLAVNDTLQLTNNTEQQAAINLLSAGSSYNYTYQLNMTNQQVSINALADNDTAYAANDSVRIVGPGTVTDEMIMVFDGISGFLAKESGYTIDTLLSDVGGIAASLDLDNLNLASLMIYNNITPTNNISISASSFTCDVFNGCNEYAPNSSFGNSSPHVVYIGFNGGTTNGKNGTAQFILPGNFRSTSPYLNVTYYWFGSTGATTHAAVFTSEIACGVDTTAIPKWGSNVSILDMYQGPNIIQTVKSPPILPGGTVQAGSICWIHTRHIGNLTEPLLISEMISLGS